MKIKKGVLLLLIVVICLTGCGGGGTVDSSDEVLAEYNFAETWKKSKFNYATDAEWISSHIRIVQLELMQKRYSLQAVGSSLLKREEFADGLYAALVNTFFEEIGEREEYAGLSEDEICGKALSYLGFLEDLSESEAWQKLVRSGIETLNTYCDAEGEAQEDPALRTETLAELLLQGSVPAAGGDRIFGIEAIREEALAGLKEDENPDMFFFADVIVASEYEALSGLYEENDTEYTFLAEELAKLKTMTADALLPAGTYEAPAKGEEKKTFTIRFADESDASSENSARFSSEAEEPVEGTD